MTSQAARSSGELSSGGRGYKTQGLQHGPTEMRDLKREAVGEEGDGNKKRLSSYGNKKTMVSELTGWKEFHDAGKKKKGVGD